MDLTVKRQEAEQRLNEFANRESQLKEELEAIKGLKHQAIGEIKLLNELESSEGTNGKLTEDEEAELAADIPEVD